jgi:transketolase
MAPEGMLQFNKDGSTVEMIGAEHSPGMEVMTGSLGQGLSQAAGIAMARKLKGDIGNVWVFMSDGEFQSGQNWEAMQAAAFHRLDNLKIIVDANGQQCDGEICSVMQMEPFEKRLESFGAEVVSVDGHDIDALLQAANTKKDGKPLVIIANTCPYKGIEVIKQRYPKFHYVRFANDEERELYRQALKDFE